MCAMQTQSFQALSTQSLLIVFPEDWIIVYIRIFYVILVQGTIEPLTDVVKVQGVIKAGLANKGMILS